MSDFQPDFPQWSLDAIRAEGANLSWLEEKRFDWATTASNALSQILDGKSIIIVTDEKRKWFENYIITSLNTDRIDRPLLPIVSIDSLYTHFNTISGEEKLDSITDMIALAHKNNYFFWYIGCGDDKRADIAKRDNNSYFWIFDEEYHNSFSLKSLDTHLDIKLLQLYKLFDLSLNATMFGEVDVSS